MERSNSMRLELKRYKLKLRTCILRCLGITDRFGKLWGQVWAVARFAIQILQWYARIFQHKDIRAQYDSMRGFYTTIM